MKPKPSSLDRFKDDLIRYSLGACVQCAKLLPNVTDKKDRDEAVKFLLSVSKSLLRRVGKDYQSQDINEAKEAILGIKARIRILEKKSK